MRVNSLVKLRVVWWLMMGSVSFLTGAMQAQTVFPDPEAISIFPLGGQQGSTFRAEVRARNLEGAHSVYFNTPDVQGRVLQSEETELEEVSPPPGETTVDRRGQRIHLEIRIQENAQPGAVRVRLAGSRGLTNHLPFLIHSLPQIREQETPHGNPKESHPLELPVVVNGKIGQKGETDYYSFRVAAGEELVFQIQSRPPEREVSGGWDPYLTLYQPGSSWFDSDRAKRLAHNSEPTSQHITAMPHLRYRFARAGNYLVEVGGESGQGGPHGSYQLQIVPAGLADQIIGWREVLKRDGWPERRFDRKVGAKWMQSLRERTIAVAEKAPERIALAASGASAGDPAAVADGRSRAGDIPPIRIRESEQTETIPELRLPALIEGSVGSPGEVDVFRFRAQAGDRLAFEVETPDTAPPHFNPRLAVLGRDGEELFSNVYKRIVRGDTFYLKTMEAKTIYTFLLSGDYTLQIRDITHQYGDPSFRYRVLVRSQIPHVGAIQLDTDRLNLVTGQVRKFLVTTDQEEAFAGEVAMRVADLPPGIELFPATRVQPDKGPHLDEGPKERFVPKKDEITLLLLANSQTPPSRQPHWVRVLAHPVIGGVLGTPFEVTRLPLMVVRPFQDTASGGSPAGSEKSP